jgi:hypothetical protein
MWEKEHILVRCCGFKFKIGKWCKIGAGAVVICDIPDFTTAVESRIPQKKLSKYRRLISIFPDKALLINLATLLLKKKNVLHYPITNLIENISTFQTRTS